LARAPAEAGVSADATGPSGETALNTCAHAGNTAAARVLIAAGASGASGDPGDSWRGQTPLMWAAAEGHAETMWALIEAGADVDARSTVVAWERQRTSEPSAARTSRRGDLRQGLWRAGLPARGRCCLRRDPPSGAR